MGARTRAGTGERVRCIAPLLAAIVVACATAPAAGAAPRLPLDIGLPTQPTLTDILATSSANGDGRGVIPGTDVCRTAPTDPLTLPADDAAHNGTYHEWWWWYGHVDTPDGRRLGYMVLFESKPWAGIQNVRYAITDLSAGSPSTWAAAVPRRREGTETTACGLAWTATTSISISRLFARP
jgi:hypothetical protein